MRISNEMTDAAFLIEFGARIRHLRIQSRIKQVELAARCGISRSALVKLERGEGGVRLVTFVGVLRQLGLLGCLDGVISAVDPSPREEAELEFAHKALRKRVRDTRQVRKTAREWGDGTPIRR